MGKVPTESRPKKVTVLHFQTGSFVNVKFCQISVFLPQEWYLVISSGFRQKTNLLEPTNHQYRGIVTLTCSVYRLEMLQLSGGGGRRKQTLTETLAPAAVGTLSSKVLYTLSILFFSTPFVVRLCNFDINKNSNIMSGQVC